MQMSHNVTLAAIKLTDMALLGTIVSELSKGAASLDMTAKTFRTYPGQPTNCDARINMPGQHDIGLRKVGSHWSPVFDPYAMSNIFRKEGTSDPIGALTQEYTLREAEYTAAQQGMTSNRINGPRGLVTLELVAAD
jgi:hypothetical protein